MIEGIQIKNFKSIKEADLELSNLNVLAGMNGMGKSSLIQVLLLLKQSEFKSLSHGRLELNSKDLLSLGKGKDIYYQFAESSTIEFKIKTQDPELLQWKFKYVSDKEYLQSEEQYREFDFSKINLFSDNFQYIDAERIGPKPTYSSAVPFEIENSRQIGNQGEFAVYYLNSFGSSFRIKHHQLFHPKGQSKNLVHQVNAWLGEISPGTKLNTTAVPGTELVILDYQFETNSDYTDCFRPINVGFGITYALPVVLSLLMAKKDRLIIIENPEAHLHPRGQAEMGRLIALAASVGSQIIIETHSDHILNGIRVAAKNGDINHRDINLFFFDRVNTDFEQYSSITPIKVDNKGELSAYPKNFLQEWNDQLFKLI